MFFLLSGDKKTKKVQTQATEDHDIAKEIFVAGRFPVVTTDAVAGRMIAKVLGLVCCRGFDSEEAFFGMASRAMKKGAHAIIGYHENIAFHPSGSKYFSCYGTAVMFTFEGDLSMRSLPAMTESDLCQRQ
jgi:uncharacterized protein YbjQ (UPF0145 family)